mgnify:CR=1 FL=1
MYSLGVDIAGLVHFLVVYQSADFLLAVGRFRHVGRQQSGLVIQLQKDCLVCIGLYRYQGIGESHGIIIIVVQARLEA